MNYEIAKKLKDAGFKQKFTNGVFYAESGSDYNSTNDCYKYFGVERRAGSPEDKLVASQCIAIPTLEELIEACDKEQVEHAVANLWLKLNT